MQLDIFALSDPAGKSATDDQLDAIILTREVEKGGEIINKLRSDNGLKSLPCVFVDMILVTDKEQEKFSNKMSSSLIRNHIMNQLN